MSLSEIEEKAIHRVGYRGSMCSCQSMLYINNILLAHLKGQNALVADIGPSVVRCPSSIANSATVATCW